MGASEDLGMKVIAERIAEVVNQRLASVEKVIKSLENRVSRLEVDMNTVRTHVIESIIRSVLGVKLDELVSAIVARLGAELSNVVLGFKEVNESIKKTTSEFRDTVQALKSLEGVPEQIVEAVRNVKVSVDLSSVESKLEDLSKAIANVEKSAKSIQKLEDKVKEISEKVKPMEEFYGNMLSALQRIESSFSEVKESVDYIKEVVGILEERIKRRSVEDEYDVGEEEV